MKNGPYEFAIAPSNYAGKLYRNRYVYQHHLVWWKYTGEYVQAGFIVHHKNHDKRDNRFENLELLTDLEHKKYHASFKPTEILKLNCSWCGMTFKRRKRTVDAIQKVRTKLFCSLRCGALNQHHCK